MQRYKLFYNEITFSIVRYEHYIQTDTVLKNCFMYESVLDLEEIISLFLHKNQSITIVCKSKEEEENLWKTITKMFVLERAAGGIVFKENLVLSIYRLGKWDFPKGHVEKGETDIQASIREVTEETGVDQLTIEKDLGNSYHIFSRNDQFVLKETHWYRMQTTSNKTLVAQTEEGIEKAIWIPKNEIDSILNGLYPSLVDLWERSLL